MKKLVVTLSMKKLVVTPSMKEPILISVLKDNEMLGMLHDLQVLIELDKETKEEGLENAMSFNSGIEEGTITIFKELLN